MNWKTKYDFWADRTVDGFVYRFRNEFEIQRRAVDEVNFQGWEEFDSPGECRRAWRKICDRSFQ
jgi:hypothetical protein